MEVCGWSTEKGGMGARNAPYLISYERRVVWMDTGGKNKGMTNWLGEGGVVWPVLCIGWVVGVREGAEVWQLTRECRGGHVWRWDIKDE